MFAALARIVMDDSLTFGRKPTKAENAIYILVFTIVWLLVIGPLAWLALVINNFSMVIWFVVASIIFFLIFWKAFSNLRAFFPVEISGKFVVFLRPVAKRAVYDMTRIKNIRLIWKWLFFRYENWPILVALRMDKDEMLKLLSSIELANNKRNEMDGSDEPPTR